MRKINYILFVVLLFAASSCTKEFLEKNPQGELSSDQLATQEGVNGALTGAYSLLNGNTNGTWGNYASGPSQWLLGEVTSDNAHKGSDNGDQPNMNALERHAPTSTNDNLSTLWTRCYEGIQRCNNTLRLIAALQASDKGKFTDEKATEIQAEARLLRAHYYFFLARAFKNVPLITETTTDPAVDNTPDIYPAIVTDLQYAADNLAVAHSSGKAGRVNKIMAQAYLGKVLLYQKKYGEALPLFNAVIASRPNIETLPYKDNFDITKENGPESIFAVQHSVGTDGSGGDNGNVGDMLNFPYGNGMPITCCGFFQPTLDLANSFKVTAAGLPFLDNSYRTNPYKSDLGLNTAQKAAYTVDRTLAIDPRMDYTMGRRGVPFRDWGIMAGDTWIRESSNGGPFVAYKNVIEASQIASGTGPGNANITGLNVNIIRLADVYLMAAECEVELGNLPRALTLVNNIRTRAGKLPPLTAGGTPVAAYNVGLYTSFPDQTYARNAVRFERRLELAMEGHRFYDLVRWGVLKPTLESYFAFEGEHFPYLKGITISDRDSYFPIPQEQLDRSNGIMKQNTGY
ncbi:RagB/SusD family nutrient uptake outer membrane protein [Pedobacter immunditicola]|uniref:RagB/SusD family nutrient uptake outer membrane protein n=1 Tax=Pedobacter immunditicola TaxID=3133440 RepID=UPI0030B5E514